MDLFGPLVNWKAFNHIDWYSEPSFEGKDAGIAGAVRGG
jgi:hypothetical protein